MKTMLFPVCRFTSRLLLGVAAITLSLVVSPSLQAQTNFDFNASTDPGWEHWLPEWYAADDGFGNFTNAINLPSVTFITNDFSANNMACFLHAGTSNSAFNLPMIVGSFITNGNPLADFTMTVEMFHWTNGQGQENGLAGRVQLPLSPVNPPNLESQTSSYAPTCITLVYANARSAKNFWFPAPDPGGSSDNLRINFVYINPYGGQSISVIASGSFSGPGVVGLPVSKPYNGYIAGTSLSPDPTNGHYRLILTALSGTNGDFTGQMVDESTGLPMQTGVGNIITTPAYYYTSNALGSYAAYLTNNGAIYTNGVLDSADTIPLGSAYGVIATLGSSGSTQTPTNNTVGQPIDPKFDNFAIVPGVVTLESAASVTGPFTKDTTAGIEVYPKRITVPANGATRFYRLNWIGCDHTPAITSITPGPTVNQVLAASTSPPITTTVTNTLATWVLTYN